MVSPQERLTDVYNDPSKTVFVYEYEPYCEHRFGKGGIFCLSIIDVAFSERYQKDLCRGCRGMHSFDY